MSAQNYPDYIKNSDIEVSNTLITVEDYELWVEMLQESDEYGRVTVFREPTSRHSDIEVNGKFSNGVKWSFKARGLYITDDGQRFYANNTNWNHISISAWAYDNFTLKGKGARGDEAHWELFTLLALLTGDKVRKAGE